MNPSKHQISIAEWHKMENIFPSNRRMELVKGELIDMAPIGSFHASCVRNLLELLANQKGKTAIIDIQNPIMLGNDSEPEPDLTLLKPVPNFYRDKHPTAQDIFLLIEVSDSTLHYDRNEKIPLYAKYGIVECWLVNLQDFWVETYLHPKPSGYTTKNILKSGQILIPSQLTHIKIPVSNILG